MGGNHKRSPHQRLGFVLAGCNRLGLHEKVMQAPGAGETGRVGSVEQVAGAGQESLGIFAGQKLQEALGADAGPAGEKALEVVFTQANAGGDLVQVGLAIGIIFDKTDGLLNAGIISGKLG